MKKQSRLTLALLAAASVGLSGCWLDDDDDDAAPVAAAGTVPPPASASASEAGLVTYLKALVASASDGLEPVDLAQFLPPDSETSEPAALD